jgi:hypothetical protein
MAEIVGGLFGVSPEQLMRQRQALDTSDAFKFANLDQMGQAQFNIARGAAGLGRAIGGLLGGDPELEKISQIKQLSSQFDLTTAQGARDFARALQPFAPQEAMMAVREADRLEAAAGERGFKAAQTVRAMREPSKTALSTLIASGKYTPASLALYKESEDPADLVLAGKEAKELPAGTMKEIATAEKNNSILTKTNTTLDDYIEKVKNDEIKFTLGTNIAGWVQKQTGKQDENTRAQVSLKKFLENERNNILLSAKGTQTEGDAQRAMSQIFDTTDWRNNDSVKQALEDLRTYKEGQIDANNVFIGTLRNEPVKQAVPPKTPAGGNKAIYNTVRARAGWEDATDAEIDAAIKAGKIKTGQAKR